MATIPQESTACSEATSDSESLSSQLLAMLNQQLSLARTGKMDEVMTSADKVDQLLSRADRKQLEKIRSDSSIRGLYDQLCLTVGAAKQETAAELERIRKGKNSLRAYKGISR
jgi:hypothetical protein